MPTIFEALRADHDRLRIRLDRVLDTEGASGARREQFEQLDREIRGHCTVEDRVYLVQLLRDPRTRPAARASLAEDRRIERALDELAAIDLDDPDWTRHLQVLRERLWRHMDEEEVAFDQAAEVLGGQLGNELGERFQAARSPLAPRH